VFAALALGLGIVVALGGTEVALRATGHGPWQDLDLDLGMPRMHEPDPVLGWRNQEGRYVFGAPPIHMTFWPDHTRATAPVPVESDATIVVLGCSFVQGWALSDEHTFAWKLQERFPKARVLNFGTAGYGTTQSLLALQGYLDAPPRSEGGSKSSAPLIVVYGFSDFHADRNIASVPWIRGLAQLASRGHVATPYASLGHDGALELHPPTRYPAWWLHRQLATVALLEERWAQLQARERTTQATAATEKLLIELDRVVRAHHGTLLVALLSQFQRNGIQPFRTSLQTHGIATAECLDPGAFAKAMQVPVYGHPNATINTHWASCIERVLAQMAPDLTARP
jgi:hypothetical protein